MPTKMPPGPVVIQATLLGAPPSFVMTPILRYSPSHLGWPDWGKAPILLSSRWQKASGQLASQPSIRFTASVEPFYLYAELAPIRPGRSPIGQDRKAIGNSRNPIRACSVIEQRCLCSCCLFFEAGRERPDGLFRPSPSPGRNLPPSAVYLGTSSSSSPLQPRPPLVPFPLPHSPSRS
jgi:hypothetical protein